MTARSTPTSIDNEALLDIDDGLRDSRGPVLIGLIPETLLHEYGGIDWSLGPGDVDTRQK